MRDRRRRDIEDVIARVIDPKPFARSDMEREYPNDLKRIRTAKKRAALVLKALDALRIELVDRI